MTDFETIYRRYFHDVFLYVKSLSRDDAVAEEVTGETFFKALRALDRFRGECDIRVWLCQIAKNSYFTYLKQHEKLTDIAEAENRPAPRDGVEEQITQRESIRQIHCALHALADPYKEVFSLRVFGELSFRDIGALFGKSENWACVTYHRARQKIMDKLEEQNRE